MSQTIAPSWQPLLEQALAAMDQKYLNGLLEHNNYFPKTAQIFNAFSLAPNKTRYILFGESPYPRAESANGYAFWDAAVDDLWSNTGLSTPVNRATSLRNIVKMLLVSQGLLNANDTSQTAISKIKKTLLIKKLSDLFNNLMGNGFLLLNASLIFRQGNVKQDSLSWQPFIRTLLASLKGYPIKLILLGKIAKLIEQFEEARHFEQLNAEHPYNLSFIHNSQVLEFFKPFELLKSYRENDYKGSAVQTKSGILI